MAENIKRLFIDKFGVEPLSVVKLSGAGSNRAYYRLCGCGSSVIGVVGTSVEENRAFVALAKAFAASGVAAPEVLALSDDGLCYLQTDLGDTTLFEALKRSREAGSFALGDVELLCSVMSALPHIQYRVPNHFDFALCYPSGDFNKRTVMWDLNYFKYCFLKGVGVEFNENLLEDEFEKLASLLLEDNDDVFLYRDFWKTRAILAHKLCKFT